MVALNPTQREDLAAAIRTRQRQLHITQREAAARGGLSQPAYNKFANARTDGIAVRSMDAIDDALGWPRGTTEAIIHGEPPPAAPAPVDPPRPDDLAALIAGDPQSREICRLVARLMDVGAGKRRALLTAFEQMIDAVG